MRKTKPPAEKTTVWIPVPGSLEKHVRIDFITETDFGPDCFEETTTARDAGLILEAMRTGKAKIQYHQPTL